MSRRTDKFKKILPTDVPRGLNATISTRPSPEPHKFAEVPFNGKGVQTGRFKTNLKTKKTPNVGKSSDVVRGVAGGRSPDTRSRAETAKRTIASTDIRVNLDFTIKFSGNMHCPRGLAEEIYSKLLRAGLNAALKEEEANRILSMSSRPTRLRFKYNKYKV